MSVETPPAFLQSGSYGAEQTRRHASSLLQRGASIGSITGGIVGSGDLALTAPVSGMSVNVAPGEVWVPGSTSSTQGGYYCRVSSTTNLAIAAADPTNPRIDTIVAQVQDAAYSGGTNSFQVAVVTGAPTAGATLINLLGAGSVPASSLVIGYVLVPANATNIITGDLATTIALVRPGIAIDQFSSGTAGARPSASASVRQIYYATDSGVLSLDPASASWLSFRAGVPTAQATSTTLAAGQSVIAAPGTTMTLPSPTAGAMVEVIPNYQVNSGGSAVTIAYGSGGGAILGSGLPVAGAASFVLGFPGASIILVADGTNWYLVAGQPDSGWIAVPSLAAGLSGTLTNYNSASFRLRGTVVMFKGAIANVSAGSFTGPFFTLASAYQPASIVTMPTYSTGAANALTIGYHGGGSAGQASTAVAVGNGQDLYLDGLSYSLV